MHFFSPLFLAAVRRPARSRAASVFHVLVRHAAHGDAKRCLALVDGMKKLERDGEILTATSWKLDVLDDSRARPSKKNKPKDGALGLLNRI